jgi:hypothetical protein
MRPALFWDIKQCTVAIPYWLFLNKQRVKERPAFFFGFLTLENGTNRLSQNIGKVLPP